MNVGKIGQMNIPKRYDITRIGLLTLIILFAWLGTGTKEATASESDYDYQDYGSGVEITKYVGTAKDITIPDTLGGKRVIRIGNIAFYNKQLTSAKIPDSVIEIGAESFGSNELTSVTIPNNVVKIESYAFSRNQLTFVEIGSEVVSIEGSAFIYNPLATIKVDEDNSNFQDIDGKGLYTKDKTMLVAGTISGEIDADTLEIGAHAFRGRGITSITIPRHVEKIGQFAFHDNQLADVVIPASVMQIELLAFGNNHLTDVEIGENVEVIGVGAFHSNWLTAVEIPDSVTTVGNSAFGDNLLTHVKIGSSAQPFSGSVFSGNPIETIELAPGNPNFQLVADGKALYSSVGETLVVGTTSGVILEGTETIGDYAFNGRLLKTISIPDSVQTIEIYAFQNNQLTKITIPDSVITIILGAFEDNPDLVLNGTCGTAAERYAYDSNIPFLSDCNPLVVQFDSDGNSGAEVKLATTKVTVYSYDELETEQYYIWTQDSTPPAFDVTTWTAFTNGQELTKTAEGEWYLHIYAQDSANNNMYHSSQLFRVVDLHPVIHISATVGDAETPYTEGEWVNQQVHVTIRAEDVNMRELRIKIGHDGDEDEFTVGSEDQFTFKRTFTESGIYQLEITASDAAGQTSTETYTFKISMDGLRLDVRFKQADGTDLSGQWTNQQSVTASVYAYNAQGLSVTDVVYSLNEGETWSPYLTPLTFADEGTHPLWVKAEDEVGNIRMEQLDIGIDRTKPEIRFEPDGNASGLRNVSSKVTVTDEQSGVAEETLRYIWSTSNQPLDEQADWQAFRSGEELSYSGTSGEWYLHIRAQDRAGNERYQVSQPFIVRKNSGGSGGDSGGDNNGSSASDYSNANLSELHVSVGQLSPAFSKDITDYRVHVEHDVEQLSLTVKTAQREATIAINGERLASGQEAVQLPLVEGTNLFHILITAPDGTKKTYTLTIEREQAKTDGPRTPQRSFTDIAGHWAEHEIKQAAAKGIVNGYPDGSFKPNHPVTRAEFTVMLVGALQLEGTNTALTFTDTAQIGAWAQQAIAQSVQLGIVAGYEDGSFRPDAAITRAEMAVMIARALQLLTVSGAPTGFADDDEIPLWAKAAVEAIRELGIVNGRGGNHFVPNDTATRTEATVMLLRILEEQLGVK